MNKQPKSKIVDLEVCEDGSYSPKDTLNIKKIDPLKGIKPKEKTTKEKPKYTQSKDVDEFLAGIDVGLDLLDEVMPRIGRFLRLRG
jgi:hypothetical protein